MDDRIDGGEPRRFVETVSALRSEVERLDAVVEIVERIMTMHWDMAACPCWVCVDGRAAGCRQREVYLNGRFHDRPSVRVD
jgi:hypothetical protein